MAAAERSTIGSSSTCLSAKLQASKLSVPGSGGSAASDSRWMASSAARSLAKSVTAERQALRSARASFKPDGVGERSARWLTRTSPRQRSSSPLPG